MTLPLDHLETLASADELSGDDAATLAEGVLALVAEVRRLRRVEEAAKLAARWLGDHRDPTGTFEDIGDWFYRETGFLRPGKSDPLECGDRDEERRRAWDEWVTGKRDLIVDALAAALRGEP